MTSLSRMMPGKLSFGAGADVEDPPAEGPGPAFLTFFFIWSLLGEIVVAGVWAAAEAVSSIALRLSGLPTG